MFNIFLFNYPNFYVIIEQNKCIGGFMKISEKIKKLRLDNKLTQKQFANKTGLSLSTIQKYEYGDFKPNDNILFRISKIFDIDISYFLENKKNQDFKKIEELHDKLFEVSYNVFEKIMERTNPFSDTDNKAKKNYNPLIDEFFTVYSENAYDMLFSINNLTFSINLNDFYEDLKKFIEFILYKHAMEVKINFISEEELEKKKLENEGNKNFIDIESIKKKND